MRKLHPTTIYTIFITLQYMAFSAFVTSYTPFMLSLGLSIEQIELTNLMFVIALVASEIPTGMLADGRGRGFSMRMGMLFCTIGTAFYAFAIGFWSAALGEVLIGIGFAFLSGATSAWITDSLKRRGEMRNLRRTLATSSSIAQAGSLTSGIAGGLIGAYISLRAPWFLGLACFALGTLFAFICINGQGEPEERINEREALRLSLKLLRAHAELRWITAISMLMALYVAFNQLWTPYFLDFMSQASLIWIWVLIKAAYVLIGWGLRRLNASGKLEVNLVAIMPILNGAGLIFLAMTTTLPLSILALVVHEVARAMELPVTQGFIQHRTESSYRATFGSVHSMLSWIGKGSGLILVTLLALTRPDTTETIRFIWLIAGSLIILGAGLLIWLRPKRL